MRVFDDMKHIHGSNILKDEDFHPIRKIKVFIRGITHVAIHDFSVTYKIILSLFTIGITLFTEDYIGFALICIATGNMLSMEIMNSAIELLCDHVEPNFDSKIGQIKDIAATAAGVSILIWIIIIMYDGAIAIQNALSIL